MIINKHLENILVFTIVFVRPLLTLASSQVHRYHRSKLHFALWFKDYLSFLVIGIKFLPSSFSVKCLTETFYFKVRFWRRWRNATRGQSVRHATCPK